MAADFPVPVLSGTHSTLLLWYVFGRYLLHASWSGFGIVFSVEKFEMEDFLVAPVDCF